MMTALGVFLIGLVVGSFLNVCIHRLPRGESVVRPRSFCPHCGYSITWYDNIPVLSFFILRGRCRQCRRRISFRYPVVELLSGLLWWGSWERSGGTPIFWIQVVFFSLLLVVSITDLETGIIPDRVALPGMALGLIGSFFFPVLQQASEGLPALARSALGMGVGGGLTYVTGLAGNWMFQKESMGGGDVKLMAMVGSFLGWEKVLLTFFTAPFFALPFALYLRWVKKEEVIAYGPFLSFAALISFFYGENLWRLFIGL